MSFRNNFAENILKSRKPFDSVFSDQFTLVFDIVREIQGHKEIKTTYEMSNQGENERVTICDGIYITKYNNGLQNLEIHLDAACYMQIGEGVGGVSVERKEDKFNIIINDSTIISLPLDSQIRQFLVSKIDNYHNRIELYFHEKESIKVIEILKDELSGVIIGKELFKSNI